MINQNRSTGAHRAAGSSAVQMPPCKYPDSPVHDWSIRELKAIYTYAQAYAAQQAAERDARVKVLEEALTCISKSHPKYEGGWTLDATISDFGGNADDYARERALMLHASTGSKARAALSNHTPTKEQIK